MATTTISDSQQFAAGQLAAWDALLDPEALKAALPGCDRFDSTGPEQYRVVIAVNLIAFTATVSGDVTIADHVPHESYRVSVTGQGSLGQVNIECHMRLAAEGERTSRLDYRIEIEALGQLGMMAGPVLNPAAKLILSQFMGNMAAEIARRNP